jgi:hypothetical protein
MARVLRGALPLALRAGWDRALEAARAQAPWLSPSALEAAASFRLAGRLRTGVVSSELVEDLAAVWMRHALAAADA